MRRWHDIEGLVRLAAHLDESFDLLGNHLRTGKALLESVRHAVLFRPVVSMQFKQSPTDCLLNSRAQFIGAKNTLRRDGQAVPAHLVLYLPRARSASRTQTSQWIGVFRPIRSGTESKQLSSPLSNSIPSYPQGCRRLRQAQDSEFHIH